MKKITLLLLLTLSILGAKAQTTYPLNYDSVRVGKVLSTNGISLYGKVYLKHVPVGATTDSILSIVNGRIRKVAKSTFTPDTTVFRTVANSRSLAQTQTALNLKANLASPTFTGTVTAAALTATSVSVTASNGIAGGFTNNSTTFPTASLINNGLGNIATFSNSGGIVTTVGNAGDITSKSFIKSGGTSSQFLKADGSIDANTYLTSSTGVSLITGTPNQVIASASTGAVTLSLPQSIATTSTPRFGELGIGTAPLFTLDATKSVSGNYIAHLHNTNTTAGTSSGLFIKAGTNASDRALNINNAANTLGLFSVLGSGALEIGQTPTTSAGTYDILTRNTSTGIVEKISSSAATSGTYTPTLTNGTNVASSSVTNAWYSRVGNIVTGMFEVSVTLTSLTTLSVINIGLPVASNFTAITDLYSNLTIARSTGTTPASILYIYADTTNDNIKAELQENAGTLTRTLAYTYQYIVK